MRMLRKYYRPDVECTSIDLLHQFTFYENHIYAFNATSSLVTRNDDF